MISIARIMPSVGDSTIAISVLLSPVHWIPVEPGMRDARADHPADQRMARRRGNALEPGDDVPEHRADQRAEDHRGRDQILVDQPLADRVGDLVQLRERRASGNRPRN